MRTRLLPPALALLLAAGLSSPAGAAAFPEASLIEIARRGARWLPACGASHSRLACLDPRYAFPATPAAAAAGLDLVLRPGRGAYDKTPLSAFAQLAGMFMGKIEAAQFGGLRIRLKLEVE